MATPKAEPPEIFIGTSRYSYPDWRGVGYPKFVKRDVKAPRQS
jgi:uncharacterized protein YecE (DUF72 family)